MKSKLITLKANNNIVAQSEMDFDAFVNQYRSVQRWLKQVQKEDFPSNYTYYRRPIICRIFIGKWEVHFDSIEVEY